MKAALLGVLILYTLCWSADAGYTIGTNLNGQIEIRWRGELVAKGAIEQVTLSKDRQAVAWVEHFFTEHPTYTNEGGFTQTDAGDLYTAQNGGVPILIREPTTSRGVDIAIAPASPFYAWYPAHLTWSSDDKHLYFMAGGCLTSSYLWRLKAGEIAPRFVTHTLDYRLVDQPDSSDVVHSYERYIPMGTNIIQLGWFQYDSALQEEPFYVKSTKLLSGVQP